MSDKQQSSKKSISSVEEVNVQYYKKNTISLDLNKPNIASVYQGEMLEMAQRVGNFGIWEYDLQAMGVTWSDEMYKIFDRDPELGPPSYSEMFNDHALIESHFFEQYQNSSSRSFEDSSFVVPVKLPSGTKYLRTSIAPILDKDGEVTKLFGLSQDITELKQLEDKLHQSQKMDAIGTLAGGFAHDFNNILSIMIGHAEILEKTLEPGKRGLHNINEVISAGYRARSLVKKILTYGRIDSVTRKPVDLSLLVIESLQMVRSSLPSNIVIENQVACRGVRVLADGVHIDQIVLNLCANAFHSMDMGGRVIVSLRQHNNCRLESFAHYVNCLVLKIEDDGHGILDEHLERIFDPFFTTKEVGRGSGLGLAVVQGIVRSYQGKISVSSSPEGSSFSVYLPLFESSGNEAVEKILDSHKGHILVVEDESSIAGLYKQALEGEGYQVSVCEHGESALKEIRSKSSNFDLVLTDQSMPKMTGKQLCQQLLDMGEGVPTILVTGYTDLMSEDEAQTAGVSEYLVKPVQLKTLFHTIEGCLKAAS